VVGVTACNMLQPKTHSSFFGVCRAWEIFMRVIGDLEENTRCMLLLSETLIW